MYEKQIGMVIENPYHVKEFLGDIENSASIFLNINPNAKSAIYIKPQSLPPAQAYNIKLFNNYFEFEIENIMLRIEKIDKDVYTYSNYESNEDKFDIKIKIKCGKDICNFSIAIKIKDKYKEDSAIISKFIKYKNLYKR